MENEEQFLEMIYRQLQELQNQCVSEKNNIKRLMREQIICDFKKLHKELTALNVRLVMIEFALLEYRNKEGFLI
ncbi:MAG: hypothetical protein ACXVPQ_01880 [Bacteroidia bacterium]